MEKIRVSVLVVNLNTLDYTKQCIEDLITQDIKFNLTIINQNSEEAGTGEYLDDLFKNHIEGKLNSNLYLLTVRNSGYNKPLNKIWNDFVEEFDTEFICFLNNDVRIAPNFLSSSIQVFDNEPIVGFVNHVTNNKEYQYWSDELEYEIIQQPYRQGWDPIFRKECYSDIPEGLIFYFGDDYIYSKLYLSGHKGAYILNSPIIHFCSQTTPEKGGSGLITGNSDRSFYMSMTDVIHHLSFEEKISKLTPEFHKLSEKIINPVNYTNNKKYTIGYIEHDEEVFNRLLGPSIKNLLGEFDILSVSDENFPSENYNRLVSISKTPYIILTHQDVTFSPDLLSRIDLTMEYLNYDFGALCMVGVNKFGNYNWSVSDKIHEVDVADCCFLIIRTDNDINFDEDIFDEYHLYVEDYCTQLNRLKNKKTYTIFTSSKESDPNFTYNPGEIFLNHHSCTVANRGFCWGRYPEFRQKFKIKWPLIKD